MNLKKQKFIKFAFSIHGCVPSQNLKGCAAPDLFVNTEIKHTETELKKYKARLYATLFHHTMVARNTVKIITIYNNLFAVIMP